MSLPPRAPERIQTGSAVTVRDAGWNGNRGVGAVATAGLTGTYTGGNRAPAVSCTAR
ncbi:hypothetical protein Nm8I071_15860 [Nonomuraea sp. TT08I-71]|nr:hypothetical protein Nm8I071_15860 [Nonomuraea sp. TT08I-71]